MSNFFKTIFIVVYSYKPSDSIKLLISYFRIIIRNRVRLTCPNRERFLDFMIEFPYRPAFFGLITEIFFRPLTIEKRNLDFITIFDCGTNIGVRMLYYKWLYPNAKIVCFEPNPINLNYLYRNIENNKLRDIVVYPFALDNKSRKIELFYGSEVRGLGSGTIFRPISANGNQHTLKVDSVRLSKYITSRVYLLKLDIEGAEGKVVDDLEEEKRFQLVDRLIIEFHYDGVTMTYPLTKIIQKLENAGYKCRHTPLMPPASFSKTTYQTCMIYANKK